MGVHSINAVIQFTGDYENPSCLPATVVQVAQSSPDHTYLVAGVVANELVDVLSNATKTYPVFAPTNDAFPENFEKTDANKNTLLNHVLATKVSSTDLNACQIVDTVGGKKIKVTKNADGVVMVNNAKVVTADLEATNGVVHSINAVIQFTGDYENPSCLPATVVKVAQSSPDHTNLVAGVVANELVDVL